MLREELFLGVIREEILPTDAEESTLTCSSPHISCPEENTNSGITILVVG